MALIQKRFARPVSSLRGWDRGGHVWAPEPDRGIDSRDRRLQLGCLSGRDRLRVKGLLITEQSLEPGGGEFALREATLGLFLSDQPSHRFSIGSDRAADIPLRQRDGWILPAGARGICRFEAPLRLVMVTIPTPLLAEVGASAEFRPKVGALDPLVIELALKLRRIASAGKLYRDTMERALVAQVAEVARPQHLAGPVTDDPRLRRAVDLIHDRLADDLSLDELAGEAGMSPFHFARAFKAALGLSPLQYVIRTRIESAMVLLRTTRLPVAEIAWRVGYGDVSRFGQHFRRQTGTTPAAFRAG